MLAVAVAVAVFGSVDVSAANTWTNKFNYHWYSFGSGQKETSDFALELMSESNERSCKMS